MPGVGRGIFRHPPQPVTSPAGRYAAVLNPAAAPAYTGYEKAVRADNPVVYYRLSETSGSAVDEMALQDATASGGMTRNIAGALTGDTDGAVDLTGGKFTITPKPSALNFGGGGFSVEAWVKRESTGVLKILVDFGYNPVYGLHFHFTAANKVRLGQHGSPWKLLAESTQTITDTNWHHLVGTWSGSGTQIGKVYIDGVDDTSADAPTSTAVEDPTTTPVFGAGVDAGDEFDGALDEVAIYASALTAAQVKRHYEAGIRAYSAVLIDDGAVAVFPMDEASGNIVDLVAGKTGTATGTPTYGAAGAVVGHTGITLDASGDYFTVADHADLDLGDGPFSIEMWLRRDTDTGGYEVVMSKGATAYAIGVTGDTFGIPDRLYITKQGTGIMVISSATVPADSTWHHWVITRSGSGAGNTLYYKDGVEGHTDQVPATVLADSAVDLSIGRRADAGDPEFLGGYAYLSFFKSVLSATQVRDHYAAGLRTYKQRILADTPAGYWRLGESSGNPQDSSGNANHATSAAGTPTYGVTGALTNDSDTAVTLDGSTEYFQVPDHNTLDAGDVFTLEGWVTRPTTTPSTIVSKGGAYQLRAYSTGTINFLRPSIVEIVDSTALIPATGFHHVVATKDGASVHLYLDGVDVTGTVSNSTCISTADPLQIGGSAGGELFGGSVDEVAVYNYALTPAQVKLHYDVGMTGVPSSTQNLTRAIGDALATLTDGLARAAEAKARTAADTLSSLSDALAGIKVFPRTAADSVASYTDGLVRSAAAKARTAADSVGSLTDSPARILTALRTGADSIGSLSDSLIGIKVQVRTIADSVGSYTDSLVRAAATRVRTGSDSIGSLTDSLVRALTARRTGADSVGSLTDALMRSAATRVRTTADSVSSISDSIGRVLSGLRGLGDSISSLAESLVRGGQSYYISPSGNDSTGDGSFGNPWATVGKFISLPPNAGDTLYCRGGTYTGTGNKNLYIPGVSGSAGSPIKIRNYPGEVPIFDAQGGNHFIIATNSGYVSSPYTGGTGSRFWVLDGLRLTNFDVQSSAVIVMGNWIDGDTVPQGDWIIRRSYLQVASGPGHGIYLGCNSSNVTVEDNTLVGCYVQGVNPTTGSAIQVYHYPSGTGNAFQRNIITGWEEGIQLWDYRTPRTFTASILHNTFLNCAINIDASYHYTLTIRDNAGESGDSYNIYDAYDSAYTTADHNYWGQSFDVTYFLLAGQSGVGAASDSKDAGALNATHTTLADAISSISDSIASLKGQIRAIADSLGSLTDSLARSAAAKVRTAADSAGSLTDGLARIATLRRTAADSVSSLTDALVKAAATRVRTAGDSVGSLTDGLVRSAGAYARSAADTLGAITDSIDAQKIVGLIVRAIGDTFGAISDAVSRVASLGRTADDTISVFSESILAVSPKLVGITRNQHGVPIPFCVVDCFVSATNEFHATTTSDANGRYSLNVQVGVEYFCVAYSPAGHVYGVTARDLVGS